MIDLQMHSHFSDGTLSPKELVQRAEKLGLTAIALTDHDTVEGLQEFMDCGNNSPVITVTGIELSVESSLPPGGHLHLIGLFINPKNEKLIENVSYLRRHRNQRAQMILDKLEDSGISLEINEVLGNSQHRAIGRPNIAKVMVDKGYVSSNELAFSLYLGEGKPAYVDKVKFNEEKAINIIKDSGGLAILAHPHSMKFSTNKQFENKLKSLKEIGLHGMEAYYPGVAKGRTREYLKIAEKYNLVVSGGSDFHGSNKENIEMGTGYGDLKIPDRVYFELEKRWRKG